MKAIDRLTSHFAGLEDRHFTVPALAGGDDPLTVYWKPWTLLQKAELRKKIAADDLTGTYVWVLINKALDGHGKPMFGREDAPALRGHVHDRVVADIALAILSDTDFYTAPGAADPVETAKGN